MIRLTPMIGMTAIAMALTACGGKDSVERKVDKYEATGGLNLAKLVGTSKNPPDEFAVIAAAPLEMPQDFAALPAPDPGTPSPRLPDAERDARALLLGDSPAQAANARTSAAEAALLAASGPAADSSIRDVLEAEQEEYQAEQDLYVVDRIIPALKELRRGELDENLVVPLEERERLATASTAPRSTGGLATIPVSGGGQSIAAPVPQTAPSAPTPPVTAARPAVDPDSGAELIYIPE